MSQTRTILSYIHQNSPHVAPVKSISRDLSPPSRAAVLEPVERAPEMPRRIPLSQRSFLNQCTDPQLRESKNSIRDSVRYAVRDYSSLRLWEYTVNRHFLSQDSLPQVTVEMVEPVVSKRPPTLRSPSILVKSEQSSRDELVQTFTEVMPICLQQKLGLEEEHMKYPSVQEAFNYATNMFLQEFKSPTTKDLCMDFMKSTSSGDLRDALTDLAYDFMDKYEELALEHFEDTVFACTTHATLTAGPLATLDNPGFYDCFSSIWMLDPPDLLEFGVHTFIAEYSGSEDHPYSFLSFKDACMSKYGETALKMNILRFYYSYRDELYKQPRKQNKLTPENLEQVPEFAVLRTTVQRLMEGEEKTPPRTKAKLLRFADGV